MFIDARNKGIIFSATDIINFTLCPHLTWLSLQSLKNPIQQSADEEMARLIKQKALEHELSVKDSLENEKYSLYNAAADSIDYLDIHTKTLSAMKEGWDYIYHGILLADGFLGQPDFLKRVDHPSSLGSYSYEAVDAKLSRSVKAHHILQLCYYSYLLSECQQIMPRHTTLALGSNNYEIYRPGDYIYYFQSIKNKFLEFLSAGDDYETFPSDNCQMCIYRELCENDWVKYEHLCIIPYMRKEQVKKLWNSGITSMSQLAECKRDIRAFDRAILDRLITQAKLQLKKMRTGENSYEFRPPDYMKKGLPLLPEPDDGDVFFDMEGYPLYGSRGLEYLFGILYRENGDFKYQAFWSHNYDEEREAFEKLVSFLVERKNGYPGAHIYHYNHYEVTALKRLMCTYARQEDEIDFLLRSKSFVDLFPIVRNSIIISEPGYSLKNLEIFYADKRAGEVKDATASMIQYEKYIETKDATILKEIEDYNHFDCNSLVGLLSWLHKIKEECPAEGMQQNETAEDKSERDYRDTSHPLEAEISNWIRSQDSLSQERSDLLESLSHMLYFHNREKKPEYWELFSRMDLTYDELLEDPLCIAGLQVEKISPVKQSLLYECSYPEQEVKIIEGQKPCFPDTLDTAGEIVSFDLFERKLRIKRSKKKHELKGPFDLIPGWPVRTEVLAKSLQDFIQDCFGHITGAGALHYKAGYEILTKSFPEITSIEKDQPLINTPGDILPLLSNVIDSMGNTYIFIQGPPGSGKTFTASHLILNLLRKKMKVAVNANAHKAINNLLKAIEERAEEYHFSSFSGYKKSSSPEHAFQGKIIKDVKDNDEIPRDVNLLGATAWTLCLQRFRDYFEYLFIDEAGQTTLANCLALSTCAKNVVLIGDQMQLGSPMQALHPGESGNTILEHLLKGISVVPPHSGVFLDRTWRMHPEVCRFISDAVYDSKLHSVGKTANQRLILPGKLKDPFPSEGISFIKVTHSGNSQKSQEEADVISSLYNELLGCEFIDSDNKSRRITSDNILIVAPYNMQVNLLRQMLPDGARVGTVDKFQGQEAEIVFVSMTTSSQEDMPRHFDFLFSKNRLNVAISRAKIKVFLFCSPELLRVKCSTPQQMELVNTLCYAAEYGGKAGT